MLALLYVLLCILWIRAAALAESVSLGLLIRGCFHSAFENAGNVICSILHSKWQGYPALCMSCFQSRVGTRRRWQGGYTKLPYFQKGTRHQHARQVL
jgi:hypothetical protein